MAGIKEIIKEPVYAVLIGQVDLSGHIPFAAAMWHDQFDIAMCLMKRLLELGYTPNDIFKSHVLHPTYYRKTVTHHLATKENAKLALKALRELGSFAESLTQTPHAVRQMLMAEDDFRCTPGHWASSRGFVPNLKALFQIAGSATGDVEYDKQLQYDMLTHWNSHSCNLMMSAISGLATGAEKHVDPEASIAKMIFLDKQV